jgi:hypothetical protein
MYRQSFLEAILNFFIGLAELILALRVLLLLFGANSGSSFVGWVYRTSSTLISPFRGIFTSQTIGRNGHILDFTAIFAMLMYAIFGFLLSTLLHFISGSATHKHS